MFHISKGNDRCWNASTDTDNLELQLYYWELNHRLWGKNFIPAPPKKIGCLRLSAFLSHKNHNELISVSPTTLLVGWAANKKILGEMLQISFGFLTVGWTKQDI